jgi:hypothetical protein
MQGKSQPFSLKIFLHLLLNLNNMGAKKLLIGVSKCPDTKLIYSDLPTLQPRQLDTSCTLTSAGILEVYNYWIISPVF